MFTKACLAVLATAALTSNGAFALTHRHAQRHHHEDKRAVVYEATETVTDTTWVTVTVDPNSEAATAVPVVDAVSTASSSVVAPPPDAYSIPTTTTSIFLTSVVVATPTAQPTTLVTSAKPAASSSSSYSFVAPQAAVVASSSAPAAITTTRAVADSSSKRGAAYNSASLISPLIGGGTHIGWAYNWGQVDDGLTDVTSDLEYVPMLWGTREDFVGSWASNAQTAINNGAKNFLSFNEPDNAGQSNMDPSTAASAHIQYMNPFGGSVKIGSPAITNSGTDGEGVSWLKQFVSACGGTCQVDFCAAHWYSPADSSDFLNFVTEVHEACENKPVWITEFAPTGADESTISSFLNEVQDALDNDSTYSFVERYAYFYVADGYLVDGSSASSYGNTFAYGA
ncbi:hypothetical protein VMCG_05447 [Cytospora schulzeri]|uniref:Asl1-like glycosyl hydrolase catalytic domain-containing protein n=1 Tax=Cytospora schulzeri TaxID=448051 RepID=A0A423WK61_9PEZI|nr:hypothetical protein VMCG_05447 [Valsa malicola]